MIITIENVLLGILVVNTFLKSISENKVEKRGSDYFRSSLVVYTFILARINVLLLIPVMVVIWR